MIVDNIINLFARKEKASCLEIQSSDEINIQKNGMAKENLSSVSGSKFRSNDFLDRFLINFGFQPGYDVQV